VKKVCQEKIWQIASTPAAAAAAADHVRSKASGRTNRAACRAARLYHLQYIFVDI